MARQAQSAHSDRETALPPKDKKLDIRYWGEYARGFGWLACTRNARSGPFDSEAQAERVAQRRWEIDSCRSRTNK